MTTVLTAIPYFGVGQEMIDNAVRHALDQDYKDHVVLVMGDGQVPPVTIKDNRLVVGSLPVNRGAPFTQQAMILANPFPWYAPHGADDWAEPEYLSSLMRLSGPARGSYKIKYRPVDGERDIITKSKNWAEFGVFRTRTLLSIGGYSPQERCGQDSLLLTILTNTVGISYMHIPRYHKVGRATSLTMDRKTGFGSTLRTGVRDRIKVTLAECQKIGWDRPGAIRAYRESLVSMDLKSALYEAVYEIERLLATPRQPPAAPAPVWDDGPEHDRPRRRYVPREVKV